MRVRVGVHAQHGRNRRRRRGRRTPSDLGARSSGRRRKHSGSVAPVNGLGGTQVLRVAELGERHVHRRQGSHNVAVGVVLVYTRPGKKNVCLKKEKEKRKDE